jgi:hypothetical protein
MKFRLFATLFSAALTVALLAASCTPGSISGPKQSPGASVSAAPADPSLPPLARCRLSLRLTFPSGATLHKREAAARRSLP